VTRALEQAASPHLPPAYSPSGLELTLGSDHTRRKEMKDALTTAPSSKHCTSRFALSAVSFPGTYPESEGEGTLEEWPEVSSQVCLWAQTADSTPRCPCRGTLPEPRW
jgi:hypothetical protein